MDRRMKAGTRARLAVPLLVLTIVAMVCVAPLWSQDREGMPTAIGFVTSDGETGISYSTAAADSQTELSLQLSSVPDIALGHLMVYLANLERAAHGAPPLKAASELMESAQFHSEWMAEYDCFAHTCSGEPGWVTRIENAGYAYWVVLGENIAGGYTTAAQVTTEWMNSPDHRSNMLSTEFREAGGGYAFSGSSTYHHYWTLDFGARNDSQEEPVYPVCPVIINNEAWSTSNLNVSLYVYGSDWPAEEMQFRNEGGSWSGWESYSSQKNWTLSCSEGSPATVYAQIRQGAVILESSDEIFVDIPFSVKPSLLIFLSEQGSGSTVPESYQLQITCCDQWTASASQGWIKVTEDAGTGTGETTVYLQGQPTTEGSYSGAITIETEHTEEATEVPVTLIVTDGPLEHSSVPMVAKQQS
jgi:uncharacterized protein YkwD